jgi:ankyrin repeat protein
MLSKANKVGWLPIYYIFEHNSKPLLDKIIKLDHSQIMHICNNGSVVIKACEVSSSRKADEGIDLLKYFIEKYKVNINQTDHQGCTALYMACYKGNYYVVKYLLENGADPGTE